MIKCACCKIPFLALFLTILVSAACRKVIVTPEEGQIKDSVVIRDSLVIVYDTVYIADTLTVVDTTFLIDTLNFHDTLTVIDTIRKIDTIRYVDTIWTEKIIVVIDTITFHDTVTYFDTIRVIDTIRVFDSIKVYDTIQITIPPPDPPNPPVNQGVLVGNGSGTLNIDASSLNGTSSTTIRIRAGTYTTISIQDLNGKPDNPITILNDGRVAVRNEMVTKNINNVTISGAGSGDSDYGFIFENLTYRAIRMSGKMNGVTIRNMSFKNVPDYCISGEADNGSGLRYDGTANTRTERFKILHCSFDNTGTIIFGGSLSSSGDTGFFKDVEVAYNIFKNSNAGNIVSFSNVQDYDIHHNVLDNINRTNNNHNAMFHMQGNGKFHHNKLTNYQGNAIRAWAYSRGNTPSLVSIYHNICYNTRKYSGFEIQQFNEKIVQGKTTHVNAEVYNNTVGRMNTLRSWQGQLLDLYNISGTLKYYNNLGFDLYSSESSKPITDMINNMSATRITTNSDNHYFQNQTDAVTTSLASKHTGIGALLE